LGSTKYEGGCLLGCIIALMMEAARTPETLVNFYQTARRYNPDDSHLRSLHRENLKSYFVHDVELKYQLSNYQLLKKDSAPGVISNLKADCSQVAFQAEVLLEKTKTRPLLF
jgi:hypothetical protein